MLAAACQGASPAVFPVGVVVLWSIGVAPTGASHHRGWNRCGCNGCHAVQRPTLLLTPGGVTSEGTQAMAASGAAADACVLLVSQHSTQCMPAQCYVCLGPPDAAAASQPHHHLMQLPGHIAVRLSFIYVLLLLLRALLVCC
jgi:hypothetical protein